MVRYGTVLGVEACNSWAANGDAGQCFRKSRVFTQWHKVAECLDEKRASRLETTGLDSSHLRIGVSSGLEILCSTRNVI